MKPSLLLLPTAALALALTACKPEQSSSTPADGNSTASNPTTTGSGVTVTAAEPSEHFMAVMSQIDVGGRVLHYQDFEGRKEMWTEIAEFLFKAAEEDGAIQLPENFDVGQFISELGVLNSSASGRSVSREGDHWILKHYSHYGKRPTGLVELMGKAQEFTIGQRLSSDTDIAFEMHMDGATLPGLMRRCSALVGEAKEMERGLEEEMPFGMTVAKMLGLSQAHIVMGVELTETGEPGMPVIPENWVLELTAHKALVAAIMPMMKDVLGAPKDIAGHQGWSLAEMVPPAPGVGQPVLIVDGEERLRLVSSPAYLTKLDGDGAKLASDKTYQSATDHFPASGNMQLYLSPEVPSGIAKWVDVVASMDEDAMMFSHIVRKVAPSKPWSFCVSIGEFGVHTTGEMPIALDASNSTMMVALSGTSVLFVGARAWKRGADRSACTLNQRNIQQAIRGHQNIHNLETGSPINWDEIFGPDGYLDEPVCPIAGRYNYLRNYPEVGVLACGGCNHEEHQLTKQQTEGW